jgi:hypothetical protein
MQYGSSAWQGQDAPQSPRGSTEREVLLTVDALSQLREAVLTHHAAAELLRASRRTQDAINRINARLRHALRAQVALVAARAFRPLPDARPAARPASPNAPNTARWATPAG